MKSFLLGKIKPLASIGLVGKNRLVISFLLVLIVFLISGGSDLSKIGEQLNDKNFLTSYDYIFSENGLLAYKNGVLLSKQSIQKFIGEDTLQKFINFCLRYLSEVWLPVKRGTFIEFRTGMINVSPIGRSCSQQERDEFEQYDKVFNNPQSFPKYLILCFRLMEFVKR